MHKGEERESKDRERELGFRAHGQTDTDFCCQQVSLCQSRNSQIYFIYNKQMAF